MINVQMQRTRIAIGFENFGPYHLARLNALAGHADVLGLELNAKSSVYDWNPTKTAQVSFRRSTLFDARRPLPRRSKIKRLIEQELDRFDPEVVFVPGWTSVMAMAMTDWCNRNAIASVVMSESNRFDSIRNPLVERLKAIIVSGHSAGLVGGNSHRRYLEILGMSGDRIESGYDVVDNDHFALECDCAPPHPRRYLLASARFIPIKNLNGLFLSFAAARKRGNMDDVDLVLLGDGPERLRLEKLRSRLGLEEVVHMPGFVQYPELPRWYGHAIAFVHVSAVEPWGLVVNEAMAAGLPVIVSRNCGAAELVRDYESGWIVNHSDLETIATHMKTLATNKACRQRMGANARGLIRNYGPARFAKGGVAAADHALRSGWRGGGFGRRLVIDAIFRCGLT